MAAGRRSWGHRAKGACAVTTTGTCHRTDMWKLQLTDCSSIHPGSQTSLCSPRWASVIAGITRDQQTKLCCGEMERCRECCGPELQIRVHPAINQCPATARRACPCGCGCFAPEVGIRRDLKAPSASPANCVKSYSRGTEQLLLLYWCWETLVESSLNFSCCIYFQEMETFIFCLGQKDQNSSILSLQWIELSLTEGGATYQLQWMVSKDGCSFYLKRKSFLSIANSIRRRYKFSGLLCNDNLFFKKENKFPVTCNVFKRRKNNFFQVRNPNSKHGNFKEDRSSGCKVKGSLL